MNGYNLSRWWFNYSFENKEAKCQHTAIFLWCIELNNRLGWKREFGIPTQDTMEGLSIGNKATYINALRDLHEWGFIEIIKESKNQYQACIIRICSEKCCCENATPLDSALIQHSTQHSNGIGSSTGVSIVPIDKQINKQTKKQVNNDKREFLDYKSKRFFKNDEANNLILEFFDHLVEIKRPPTLRSARMIMKRLNKAKCVEQIIESIEKAIAGQYFTIYLEVQRDSYSSNLSFEKKINGAAASPNTFSRASNGLIIK
jgi:hypothetical protein